MWMKPKNLKVSGFPSPRFFRFSVAKRPNSIKRVFSGCSSSPNFASLSRNCSKNLLRVLPVLEPQHSIIRIAHDDHVAARPLLPPCVHPQIQGVVQVEIGKDRRNHRPLRTTFLRLVPLPLFDDARLEPFLYQADYASVSDPMFHKLNQPSMLNFVEKGPNIQIQNPVHFLAHDPRPQRIQCIMLAAPGPETVTEAQEVLFPNLVENRSNRVLDDLVLQCRDSQRPLPPVGFRNPDSSRRLRSIGSTMDSPMQVGKPHLQVLSSHVIPSTPGAACFFRLW